MPEWGNIPIPAKLLSQGVTDMVRITDGRMSGTGFGTVVLHVAHFSEGRDDLNRAFDDAGLSARLRLSDHGTWVPLSAGS